MKSELSMKAAVFLRAAEIIEIGHCKGWFARDKEGNLVSPWDMTAVAWCMSGAIRKALDEFGEFENICGYTWNADWNDAPETTQAQVAARLREEAFK